MHQSDDVVDVDVTNSRYIAHGRPHHSNRTRTRVDVTTNGLPSCPSKMATGLRPSDFGSLLDSARDGEGGEKGRREGGRREGLLHGLGGVDAPVVDCALTLFVETKKTPHLTSCGAEMSWDRSFRIPFIPSLLLFRCFVYC